ncbi:MAG: DUF1700 domain-containing protein [Clostridia bacterium]|nr:DUF1700 domain-containing protein [Clostridia bacterium]
MTKSEFIGGLLAAISDLPEVERSKYIEYYAEMIDDAIEDGMSEEEVVASLGSIQETEAQIRSDSEMHENTTPVQEAPKKQKKGLSTVVIIALIVGSPIWLGLLCALLGVYISVWAVILSLYAADLSMAVAGIASVITFPLLVGGNVSGAFLNLAAGLFCAGLSVFMFHGILLLCKGVIKLTVICFKDVMSWFGREV